jgi:hypothetical protein
MSKVNGFSKDWEWKEEDPKPPKKKKVSKDAEARAKTILKLRQKGHKVSYSAGGVGLARKILAEDGKKWRGKMNKSSARKIIRRYAFGENIKMPHIRQSSENFYRSREWRQVRYEALIKCGRACMCCGAKPKDGIILHVDHVKPRSKYPQLELDINNLQILCEDCNLGKSNIYEDDFREK